MRVILAVSGTLQEGFALRANLDAPGAPAVHLGPGVVRGVKSYLDAKQGNPSPNPACVVTGNDNDANVYELYLVDSEAVLKSLLGEPRYLAMSPDAVQLDLSAAETSAGVAALARNLLGDAAASTCAVLAVVSAVSGAPSYVPTPSDRANGMTDFA